MITRSNQGLPTDPRGALRMARIIHSMLVIGMFLLGAVATVVIIGGEHAADPVPGDEPIPRQLIIAAGVLTVLIVLPALLFGGILVRKSILDEGLSVAERVQRYVGSRVMISALIEGPGVLWGVLAILSRDLVYLSGLGFSVFALLSMAPRASDWEDAGFDLRRGFEGERIGDR